MPPSVHVYRASAGSGKTFTLVSRYLSFLLSSPERESFTHILAVTFTNKATGEMKLRILSSLYDIAYTLPQGEGLLREVRRHTGLPVERIRLRALQALHAVVHHYDGLAVMTLDSFFKHIVDGVALELGLPAGFQVDTDEADVAAQAVDRLIEELQDGSAEARWMAQALEERLEEGRKWDLRKELCDFAAKNLFSEYYLRAESLGGGIYRDARRLWQYDRALRSLSAKAQAEMRSMGQAWLEKLKGEGVEEKTFSNGDKAFHAYFQALQRGETRKKTGSVSEPGKLLQAKMEDTDTWVTKKNKDRDSLLEKAERLRPFVIACEERRRELCRTIESVRGTTRRLSSLFLLSSLREREKSICGDRERYVLSTIPLLIRSLIGGSDAPFVLEKAGTRYDNILVDEFQDTSRLQWDNLKTLFSGLVSEGRESLIVGDIKQSIYRWRGGDWKNLATIASTLPPGSVREESLQKNWRSAGGVVEFNNILFQNILETLRPTPWGAAMEDIYRDVRQSAQDSAETGYVEVSLYAGQEEDAPLPGGDGGDFVGDGQDRKRKAVRNKILKNLCDNILSLRSFGLPYSEMLILVRQRADLDDVAQYMALHAPQIPLVSAEAYALGSSTALQTLFAAWRLLLDPRDRIAAELLKEETDNMPWQEEVMTRLKEERKKLLAQPCYELLCHLTSMLRLQEREGQDAYLMRLFDKMLAFLSERPRDKAETLAYWDEKLRLTQLPLSPGEGLRIMTIHKAKGLEAHTVFVPFAGWDLYNNKDERWWAPTEPPYNELPLVPVKLEKTLSCTIYKEAYENDCMEQAIESVNLLYVALTRARKNLFVSAEQKKEGTSGPNSTATLLEAALQNELSEGSTRTLRKGERVTRWQPQTEEKQDHNPFRATAEKQMLPFSPGEGKWQFRQSAASRAFTLPPEGEEARREEFIQQGSLFHRILSMIKDEDGLETALQEARRDGLLPKRESEETMRRLFLRGMRTPLVRQWFAKGQEVLSERAILLPAGGEALERRPDRVTRRGEELTVVDFKFGTPREQHRHQVEEYMLLLQSMGGRNIRGYLWYVYQNEVTPVPLPASGSGQKENTPDLIHPTTLDR